MTSMSSCRHFEFHDILSATENFDESLVIGHGGFGKVYKGNIIMDGSTSVVAAIKRLDSMSSQGAAEFWAEVETLSKLRHCNLVSMIGYCNHGKEMILVYEYMPNGTLEDHLHKLGAPLTWLQRLKICIGAGRGLHYLHTGTGIESGVIHRDVKSSNILLHESWAAKISDFGLSKIGPTNQPTTYVNTLIKGTFGYLDPDYYATGKLTRKSDVYAFGVVMLELLCRRRALDRSLDEEQMNLARWVQESIKEGNLKHIVDSDIRGEIAPKSLKEFVRIAEGCLHTSTKQRLTMAQVLVSLENVLILQEKYNNSLQPAGRTLLGRMVNMLPFSSNGENSVVQKLVKIETEGNGGVHQNEVCRVFSTVDGVAGAQKAAGWPAWLTAVAGEAIKGWLPRRADSFEKLDKIGQGTCSNVYKARDLETGNIVALKKVRVDITDPESVRFMAREIIVQRRLDHPNVMKLEGLITTRLSSSLYLVFEHMEHDLAGLAATPKIKFTEPQIKCYMQQLLCGLEHCHKRGVLHRDIKCSNLLIDNNGNLKLGDFGSATFFSSNQKQPLTSQVVTLWYRPPELLLGATDYGVAVDLWSAGCILAELFAGKPILPGRMEVEQLHKIFKLCGSPSEEYWRKRLPYATIFKPQQPYKRCVAETYRDFPPPALALLDTLLAFEPDKRGSSSSALQSKFLTLKPLPCHPSSLPKYLPSKEYDAKMRDEHTMDEEITREREREEERRLEKERIREIEREKARQAVERTNREARERAASEARLKAERAAVQRAQTEARERAAVEARERAERAAAEAKERAAAEKAVAEAKEKEAREKAAVAKAQAEARRRAERAAVEKVTAEARERAAAEARDRAAAEAQGRAAATAKMNQQKNDNDFDSFFTMESQPSSVPKARATTTDSATDPLFWDKRGPEGTNRPSTTGAPSDVRKPSSTTNFDDLSSIFEVSSSAGDFQNVEGETEERRRARLERQQRTQERAAKALAEKNQRDLQIQNEQEERQRVSATLDVEIKRWAAGKEGNLRAMLSTLQYVLWPECGWQPISLTDLITGASVKKAYRKATLCIHPDKVQQKGANLQQKYVAEKVFDLLKEAWNKFNSEELF